MGRKEGYPMPKPVHSTLTRASALDHGRPWALPRKRRILLMFFTAAQLLLGACVVPLPYDEEPDLTSGNYPPIIRDATPSMSYTGTIPTLPDLSTWSIEVEDRNVDDVLFVRVLRNYNPANPGAGTQVFDEEYEPTGEPERTLPLVTAAWCPNGVSSEFLFEVIVADGPFDPQRPFHNVVEGADSSTRAWRVMCEADGT